MAVKIVAALVCLVVMLRLSEAAVYKVGDSAGWTTIANVDYKLWASTKSFLIGDTVLFEYNPQFHNVMRVTHQMYRTCNTSNPISTFTTGNDSITLTNHGHHFFFCVVPGHCAAGQKLDLNVLLPASSTPLSKSPTSSPPPLTATIKGKLVSVGGGLSPSLDPTSLDKEGFGFRNPIPAQHAISCGVIIKYQTCSLAEIIADTVDWL